MTPAVKLLTLLLLLPVLPACTGCDGDNRSTPAAPASQPAPTTRAATSLDPAATRPAGEVRVVFLGDSITAGYGLEADQAFPALVERTLKDEGLVVRVTNAGVSGDTTAGGLRRLDWVLRQSPDVLVVGLGGNDGLRALAPKASEDNLRAIVRKAREAGASVLLLGMLIPPNYGPEYTQQFREIYPRLAEELDVPLVPFVLEGVGGDPELNQPDGIHPTAAGHRIVADNVLPQVRTLVRERAAARR